jgi:hypothetical protein
MIMYYSDSDGIKGFGMGAEGDPFGMSDTACNPDRGVACDR